MILAIALLGLSVSLIHDRCKTFGDNNRVCLFSSADTIFSNHTSRTVDYSIFLGIWGMLISAIGTVALFVDGIPTVVPLVGDCLGALFFLAGGIAWVVRIGSRQWSCSELRDGNWEEIFDSDWYVKYFGWIVPQDAKDWTQDAVASTCRQGEAAHGLAWALFAFTAGLAICDYFRRRDQAKSLR